MTTSSPQETSELRQRGIEMRQRLLGAERAVAGRAAVDEIAPDYGRIADEVLMAQIWARPGIELKTRCLCTVSALLATERYEYARVHVWVAKGQGVTRDELCEVALQLMFYGGISICKAGLEIIKEVFEDDSGAPPSSRISR